MIVVKDEDHDGDGNSDENRKNDDNNTNDDNYNIRHNTSQYDIEVQ